MKFAGWRRVSRDLKNRQYVDAYIISLVAFILAGLSLVAGIVPDEARWATLLAGVGFLVLRVTIPESPYGTIDNLLNDRFAFDANPISDRLRSATEVWIFAPSGVNLLSAQNCEILRTGPLNRPSGVVRVVVLNPDNQTAVQLAARQLDDALDYPLQDFAACLQTTTGLLHAMAAWQINGSFEYGFINYNPGFSLVAIDPSSRNGLAIVEFHGFHNESTQARMHIEISRHQSDRWYTYWTDQFERIWQAASHSASG
jgi:hypothetical protein